MGGIQCIITAIPRNGNYINFGYEFRGDPVFYHFVFHWYSVIVLDTVRTPKGPVDVLCLHCFPVLLLERCGRESMGRLGIRERDSKICWPWHLEDCGPRYCGSRDNTNYGCKLA